MNSSDLADHIAGAHGLTKADAKKIVDAVFAAIGNAAAKGDEVSIPGFGKFKVKHSPAREGRNPRTGEPVPVEEKFVPFFKTGKDLRDRLNGSDSPE